MKVCLLEEKEILLKVEFVFVQLLSGQESSRQTEFQEISQERLGITPEYRVIAQEGLDHSKVFTVEVIVEHKVYGSGTGKSKKKAEQMAASRALASFDDIQDKN